MESEKPRKNVHIETWGCQMNVADSETMLALLQQNNYETTHDATKADLVILNTCHIREKSYHKVMSRLGRLKALKTKNPQLRIAVTGCVAQAEGKRLLADAQHIDLLLGPAQITELPTLLDKLENNNQTQTALGFKAPSSQSLINAPAVMKQKAQSPLTGKNEVSRYVNIMQGCDNFCTFCIVPHTRGREISRLPNEIIEEVLIHLKQGAQEICLLGQNVNSYGQDLLRQNKIESTPQGPFVDLLSQLAQIDSLKRLRFTTSNPHDFTTHLAKLFSKYPQKLGSYLHLPVQSGNNEVLARMKRKVTIEQYLARVHQLRQQDPDFAISTDIIVGFPGESQEQFEDTLHLVNQVRFSFIFAFMYSPRKFTPAARFKDQVPEAEKKRRLYELNKLQDAITLELNQNEIGQTRQVLFLYPSQKEANTYYGRTEHYRLTKVTTSKNPLGQILPVHITEANKTALLGRLD